MTGSGAIKVTVAACALWSISLVPGVCAQEYSHHFYDVHGRLQASAKPLAAGGNVTRYGLDGATNRTSRRSEAIPARSATHLLGPGEFITASQHMRSADGRFHLHVQLDGNVVLYGPSGFMWSAAGTYGRQSTTMTMQTDGNLTIRGPADELLWQSGTGGHPGAVFVVQDDGNLVIYAGGAAVWASYWGL